MKKYLLLLHEDISKMQKLSPKEMEELIGAHMAWANQLAESGHMISGDGLEENSVQISGKDCVVKDGTFIESKEMIGGYYLLQAKDLDSIIDIAKACPCHLWGGTTEIRPIMEYEG
ncbi:YciI family protein [Galbibacter sp. EGI 63066]|uniref:YciI family protein n=1 Tax=Galbibacter sp. EGI 63066 TaxID=2993559 RepID=UPI00224982A4|nr:YciI family protein [Galbibacter sp. EGI 63066]MCX2681735.1 YciI family protein [Galbibacter sp. EGI 63066]